MCRKPYVFLNNAQHTLWTFVHIMTVFVNILAITTDSQRGKGVSSIKVWKSKESIMIDRLILSLTKTKKNSIGLWWSED